MANLSDVVAAATQAETAAAATAAAQADLDALQTTINADTASELAARDAAFAAWQAADVIAKNARGWNDAFTIYGAAVAAEQAAVATLQQTMREYLGIP